MLLLFSPCVMVICLCQYVHFMCRVARCAHEYGGQRSMESFFLSHSPLWEVCLVELGVQQFDQAGWPLSCNLPVSSPSRSAVTDLWHCPLLLWHVGYQNSGIHAWCGRLLTGRVNCSAKAYFLKKNSCIENCVGVYVSSLAKGARSPRAGNTENYKPADVGARYQSQVLSKSSTGF